MIRPLRNFLYQTTQGNRKISEQWQPIRELISKLEDRIWLSLLFGGPDLILMGGPYSLRTYYGPREDLKLLGRKLGVVVDLTTTGNRIDEIAYYFELNRVGRELAAYINDRGCPIVLNVGTDEVARNNLYPIDVSLRLLKDAFPGSYICNLPPRLIDFPTEPEEEEKREERIKSFNAQVKIRWPDRTIDLFQEVVWAHSAKNFPNHYLGLTPEIDLQVRIPAIIQAVRGHGTS